ncbi:hypothetical protein [Lysobacter arvi]|uniref:Lipoprotein n=1 Tax=Lysobacter arvi TaxID=3038776 RepID=A0ABU1CHG8_9GAMM|nr:hypothetical protein [Lysobacter arvi]MDR0184399.1 hypothetical protein [Lysobacter arvi]
MKFQALLYFVLSLFGCDVGRSTFVDRIVHDGASTLESRAVVEAGVARFECIRSASGQCHYTLFARDCSAANAKSGSCVSTPIRRFVVADGDTRQIAGLRDFRLCVSDEDGAVAPGCPMLKPATR